MMNKINGIILAGGLSSRMGQDKGLLPYQGRTLIEYCIDVLQPLCSEIIISSNNKAYEQFGFKVIADEFKKTGPIGGLYTGLAESSHNEVIVCPCDMPFITSDIFNKVLCHKDESTAVVVKSTTGKLYPTLGYYNKSCLPVIHQHIELQHYKMQLLLKELNAKTVLIEDAHSLLNFNSPEDLR